MSSIWSDIASYNYAVPAVFLAAKTVVFRFPTVRPSSRSLSALQLFHALYTPPRSLSLSLTLASIWMHCETERSSATTLSS